LDVTAATSTQCPATSEEPKAGCRPYQAVPNTPISIVRRSASPLSRITDTQAEKQEGNSKKMNRPMGFQTLVDHFKKNNWSFQVDANRPALYATFKGNNTIFRCVIVVDEADDLLQVICIIPINVVPHKRPAAAELCARLSSLMKMGNFDLGWDDGGLRFRT